jgi:DNA-binding transcriptional MerR regulator
MSFDLTLESVSEFKLLLAEVCSMRSGQLARLTAVSTDTLRHYERLGLLPLFQRRAGNYREYPPSSQRRVELIQLALAIGFSLSELQAILALRDKGSAPCRRVRSLLRSKIHGLDQQVRNWFPCAPK